MIFLLFFIFLWFDNYVGVDMSQETCVVFLVVLNDDDVMGG